MRILVIDDSPPKRAHVLKVLTEGFEAYPPTVQEADDYDSAMRALESYHFDLVILDLLLPGPTGESSIEISRAIMRNVLQGTATLAPAHIIGLTAFAEFATDEMESFGDKLLSLEVYSDTDLGWADRMISKIRYLMKSKLAATSFQANSYDYDIVILTARYENEYLPISKFLMPNPSTKSHSLWKGDASFGFMSMPEGRSLRAAILCVGEMGMAPTAAVASQAISLFRPRLITMVGMCCGFAADSCASPRKIMDVIVAREVRCWEEGRYEDMARNRPEFKNKAKARLVDDVIREKVAQGIEKEVDTLRPTLQRFSETEDYLKIVNAFPEGYVRTVPNVQYSTMVSGSSVVADKSMVSEIIERNPTALALDMELFGLYCAVEKSIGKRPSVLGLKGVADFGEVEKSDEAQKGASLGSAIVLQNLLPVLDIW